MKFISRKDLLFSLIIFGVSFFLIGMMVLSIFKGEVESKSYLPVLIILVIVALIFWMYFGTYYKLNKTELFYKCGPIRGKIEISRIREIIKGKTLFAGLRVATATKGLIIKYNRYDEIYISPETNETFIEEILKLNPAIKIIE